MRYLASLLFALLLPVQAIDIQHLLGWETMGVRTFNYVESTGNNASLATSSHTLKANTLYFVVVAISDSVTTTTTGVTGNGLTWVAVGTVRDFNNVATPISELSVWRSAGQAPSVGAITASFSTTTDSSIVAVIEVENAKVTGSNGADAIVQATDGTSANGATTLTLTAGAAITAGQGNCMIAFYATDVQPMAGTAETGWTEVLDDGINTPNTGVGVYARVDGNDNSSAVTVATSDWAGIIVEVAHK